MLTVPQTDGTYKIGNDQRYIIDESSRTSGRNRGLFVVTCPSPVPANDVVVFRSS